MSRPVIGFAVCGSFCTFEQIIGILKKTAENYDVIPILSENSAATDTRFGKADGFIAEVEEICSRSVISTITQAEPVGPQKLLDLLVIAPCTGNTIAKIATGITDTSVTMAYKAHMRNDRPVLIAVSTNDGLSANAKNIGLLMERKNNYFVPFWQDDPENKPTSIVADFAALPDAIEKALKGKQLQPVLKVCAPQ